MKQRGVGDGIFIVDAESNAGSLLFWDSPFPKEESKEEEEEEEEEGHQRHQQQQQYHRQEVIGRSYSSSSGISSYRSSSDLEKKQDYIFQVS